MPLTISYRRLFGAAGICIAAAAGLCGGVALAQGKPAIDVKSAVLHGAADTLAVLGTVFMFAGSAIGLGAVREEQSHHYQRGGLPTDLPHRPIF